MSDPDSSQPIQPWKVYEIAKVLVNDTKVPESCCVNLEHRHACMAGDEQFIFHKVRVLVVGFFLLSITN